MQNAAVGAVLMRTLRRIEASVTPKMTRAPVRAAQVRLGRPPPRSPPLALSRLHPGWTLGCMDDACTTLGISPPSVHGPGDWRRNESRVGSHDGHIEEQAFTRLDPVSVF